jgi:hypothetical protein
MMNTTSKTDALALVNATAERMNAARAEYELCLDAIARAQVMADGFDKAERLYALCDVREATATAYSKARSAWKDAVRALDRATDMAA